MRQTEPAVRIRQHQPLRRLCSRILLTLSIMLGLWMLCDAPGVNAQTAEPITCQVGVYVIAVHNLDFEEGTYEIEARLWSVCPQGIPSPLDTMEFVNADEVTPSLTSNQDRDGVTWSSREIFAIVRQQWDLINYPFDTQTLELQMEEAELEASALVYAPDSANTAYNPTIDIDGWRITEFSLDPSTATYSTTYGDPDLPPGSGSEFSRLTLNIGIDRTELSSFFKLTAIVYAAFLLVLISYFLHLDNIHPMSSQIGLLASALFATAINMRSVQSDLGSEGGLALIDKIHILVLISIAFTGATVVVTSLLVNRGWEQAAIVRLHAREAAVTAIGFVAANAVLIGMAVRGS